MANEDAVSLNSLPLPDRRRIDEICIEFERAWQQEAHPRIESYLERVAVSARQVLLVELIAQEIDLRSMRGEIVRQQQYYERFPDATQRVDDAFALIWSRARCWFSRQSHHRSTGDSL